MAGILFNIEDREVASTATQLRIGAITPGDNGQAEVIYTLISAEGKEIESGIKLIPMSALTALSSVPLNLEAVNMVLAGFSITAIEQIQ